jgi:hypothetical protein
MTMENSVVWLRSDPKGSEFERSDLYIECKVVTFLLIIASCFQGEVLDDSTLKRLILLFEKRALRNQEMRIKFPDMPEKYIYLSYFYYIGLNLFSEFCFPRI